MRTKGADYDAVAADLVAARDELMPLFRTEPDVWARSRPGHWTGGQHLEHVAITLERFTTAFEAALQRLRQGKLSPPPPRDLMQKLFLTVVVRRGFMPRGGKTGDWAHPPASPERAGVEERLRRGTDRLIALGRGLGSSERDALWIQNPFMESWHYRITEALRVQAVHFRHHGGQVRELAGR